VSEGDAVAAIVYATDATAAGDRVEAVDLPAAGNVTASYPIAVLEDAANPDLAAAFRSYVLSEDGQAVLRDAGFLAP
jgi:molybdate transport system substrate-binding protein